MTDIQKNYHDYFQKIGTATITESAQNLIMKRPQSWNRFFEEAIMNTINDGELEKSEARFYRDYFQDAHERISLKSMEKVVAAMKESGVTLEKNGEELRIHSNAMDKVTLMGWLADLFPKYG